MRTKLSFIVGGVVVSGLIVVGTALAFRLNAPMPQSVDSTGAKPTLAVSRVQAAEVGEQQVEQAVWGLEKRARQLAAQRRAERGQVAPTSAPSAHDVEPTEKLHGYPIKTIDAASAAFDDMLLVRGLINTEELRREATDRLLSEPEALDLVVDAVSDPQFAETVFGDKQAEARFFGIKVIEHAASEGDTEALLSAIKDVRENLVSSPEFDEGLAEDLRGLLTAYARLLPEDQLTAQAATEVGYSADLSMQIRQQYYDGFLTALWERFGLEEANAGLALIFSAQQ